MREVAEYQYGNPSPRSLPFPRQVGVSHLLRMPPAKKGHAFDKPTCNKSFKLESRKIAKAAAAKQPTDELEKECCAIIAQHEHGLGEDRANAARAELSSLVGTLRSGINPLSALKPPPTCRPCSGSKGGTHKLFCLGRKQQPAVDETKARQAIFPRFRRAWVEQQHARQTEDG